MFAVRDLPKIVKPTNTICKQCVLAKHNKTSFPSKKFTTTTKLEIVHTYLSGPTKTKAFYGERYFMILVDDFSRMMWVAFVKEKYEAFDKFKIFNGELQEEVYIEHPEGYPLTDDKEIVCRLNKALYGFKKHPKPSMQGWTRI